MQHASNPWQNNSVSGNVLPSPVVFPSLDNNPMNCGGGLPPQLTPVSTAMYGTTSTFSWAHTVPSLMPWVTQGEAHPPEPVIHFTAPFPPDPCTSQTATSWELLNNFAAHKNNVNSHLKRKNELDVLETAPQKLCITEERMTARFREMHISNQYAVPSDGPSFGPCSLTNNNVVENSITNLNQLDYILKGTDVDSSSPSKSLVLAPEIKKLVEPEKIFASTFLSKVWPHTLCMLDDSTKLRERPSMALMLWQPQNNGVLGTSENSKDSKGEEEKDSLANSFLPPQLSALCTQHLISNLHMKDVKTAFDVEMDS